MKAKLITGLLILLIFFFTLAEPVQAQGQSGCLANPPSPSGPQYEVVQTVALTSAIPETVSNQTPGVFYENQVVLIFQPGWAVILSSTPDGNGALCSDDLVQIQSSAGLLFKHDFRSADRNRIMPLEPLDVTGLFTAGNNVIDLRLLDLSPKFKSSAAYYLVVIAPSPSILLPSRAAIVMPTLPAVAATSTLIPLPTISPTITPTTFSSPMPMATSMPIQVVIEPASAPSELLYISWPFPPHYLWFGLTLLTVIMVIAWMIGRQPRLTGVLEITRNGEPWEIVDLSAYGRAVTIGRKGRIKLEDDDEDNPTIPRIAARLIAERGPDGQVHIVWQNEGENSDLEATAYHIRHGHTEIIEAYRLMYENLSETELEETYIDGGIWNEL